MISRYLRCSHCSKSPEGHLELSIKRISNPTTTLTIAGSHRAKAFLEGIFGKIWSRDQSRKTLIANQLPSGNNWTIHIIKRYDICFLEKKEIEMVKPSPWSTDQSRETSLDKRGK